MGKKSGKAFREFAAKIQMRCMDEIFARAGLILHPKNKNGKVLPFTCKTENKVVFCLHSQLNGGRSPKNY